MASKHAAFWVLAAGVSAALHVGKIAPTLPLLRASLDIGLLEAGLLLSMVQFAGMACGLLFGMLGDQWGLRRTVICGLMVMAIAGYAGGHAQTPGVLLLCRAMEGVGLLLVALPAPALLRQWVVADRLAFALGVWGTYMPLGTALALLLGPYVLEWAGWRIWWDVLATVSLLMALCVARFVPSDEANSRQPASIIPRTATATATATARTTVPGPRTSRLALTLGSRGPWLVGLAFCVYSAQWLMVIGFLPSIYAADNVAGTRAGALTAFVALGNIAGNLASGKLQQRGVAPWALLMLGFSVMGVMAVLGFAELGIGPWWRYLAICVFSCVGGLIPGTLFSLAVSLAPNKNAISTTVGWMQQLSATGQFFGPPLAGLLAQASGGWHNTWMLCAVCCGIGLVIAQIVRRTPARP